MQSRDAALPLPLEMVAPEQRSCQGRFQELGSICCSCTLATTHWKQDMHPQICTALDGSCGETIDRAKEEDSPSTHSRFDTRSLEWDLGTPIPSSLISCLAAVRRWALQHSRARPDIHPRDTAVNPQRRAGMGPDRSARHVWQDSRDYPQDLAQYGAPVKPASPPAVIVDA